MDNEVPDIDREQDQIEESEKQNSDYFPVPFGTRYDTVVGPFSND